MAYSDSTTPRLASRIPCSLAVTAALLAVAAAGCSAEDRASQGEGGKPIVQAVNYPLAYFAERVAGERVDVGFLAPAGIDPAFWKPSDDDIAALQSADRLLINGAAYAKWRTSVSLYRSRLVDTSASFRGEFIETEETITHSHGDEGEHSHAGVAFTTWIDFQQARQQAEAVRDALVELVPDAKSEFTQRADTLLGEIDALDASMREVCKSVGASPLLGSHPVYQYLARRYGLPIESLHWEPETVPDEAAMRELAELRTRHAARWMIWEGEPAAESVRKLEAEGIGSVVFDPCANRPDGGGDWMSVMRKNIENLRAVDATPR